MYHRASFNIEFPFRYTYLTTKRGPHLSLLYKLFRSAKAIAHFTYASTELVLSRPKTRAQRAAWLGTFCGRVLRSMDITFDIVGPVPMSGAVISNHLTYIDILIHASIRPCVFVAKAELRHQPIVGWMSFMSGTVYVARGQGGSAAKAAEGMAKGFRDGLPVVFFPEGTTSVGDQPALPFRSGLIAQTIEAGAPMHPAFIHYTLSPQDLALGKSTRNDVHWGTQPMIAHLWNFLGLHHLHATIRFANEPIHFTPEAIADRKIAAEQAHQAVVALSVPSQT